MNAEALYRAVEEARWARLQSWGQVAAEVGLRRSAFSDLRHGKGLRADTLIKVMDWLGQHDMTPFVRRDRTAA